MKLNFDEIRSIFFMADIAKDEVYLDNDMKLILQKLFMELNSKEQSELIEEFTWITYKLEVK